MEVLAYGRTLQKRADHVLNTDWRILLHLCGLLLRIYCGLLLSIEERRSGGRLGGAGPAQGWSKGRSKGGICNNMSPTVYNVIRYANPPARMLAMDDGRWTRDKGATTLRHMLSSATHALVRIGSLSGEVSYWRGIGEVLVGCW